jgi:uncharacterized protein
VASIRKISVGESQTTAIVYAAPSSTKARARLILAHGAGADQHHRFMVRTAEGIAARGVEVITFNFLYTESGRRAPDRAPVLEACWRAVIAEFARAGLFIGGKSMGGRIASQVAAAGVDGVAGLVFLGYPLHPPSQPEKRRDAHLPRVRPPMLFVQGERDAFGGADEMTPLVKTLPNAELYLVEGGDHSLTVPKRAARTQDEVDTAMIEKMVRWVEQHA